MRRLADVMQPHMAVHGATEKRSSAEGRGVIIKRKPPWSPLSTARGLSSAETMATFHTDEIFSFATFRVNQAGQGEMAGTHAMPLLKGGREGGREGESGLTECTEKTKKAE